MSISIQSAVQERIKLQETIQKAKYKIADIERKVKEQLIEDREYEILSVNWVLLNKAYR